MIELLKEMFSGFWKFIGGLIVLGLLLHYVINLLLLSWGRFLRMFVLLKNGYPPSHCDADGDFLKSKDKTEQSEVNNT